MSVPAVFIDKDGTLIEDVPYNVDPRLIVLRAGAADALGRLAAAGYRLIVVSNQPGVAFGRYSPRALEPVSRRLNELLGEPLLGGFYYCFHHPDAHGPLGGPCQCRKPAPGLILQAAKDHGLDVQQSWIVGDILNDVEAGNRAGCRSLLLDGGGETEWRDGPFRTPAAIVSSWPEVADRILTSQPRDATPVLPASSPINPASQPA